ncbi:hypothetical protein ACFQ9X_55220 [Catenulispora yoronensis]
MHDLAAEPHTCMRYDRHAVYLGDPGPDQDCPAVAVGRAATVRIASDGTVTRTRDAQHGGPGDGDRGDRDRDAARYGEVPQPVPGRAPPARRSSPPPPTPASGSTPARRRPRT